MPTTQWKPGQTVEYTRTVFVPIYPYVGEATIQIGLYSTANQKRLPLAGEDAGQHAYKVAKLQLQPQTENVFTVFKDGWHPAEVAEHNADGRVAVDEEGGDAVVQEPEEGRRVLLRRRQPGQRASTSRSRCRSASAARPVDEFTLKPKEPDAAEDSADGGAAGDGDDGGTAHLGR